MAIFHLSVKTFSRSKGQSATASVAYRAGAKIECEREGRTHDYTKKGGVLHSEIFLPDNAPDWANDRQKLWNEAEKAEKRKNSTVAREFEVALPYELNEEQRIALVQDFAKQIVDRHGCAVDAHLHDDDRRTVKANHHAHIMLTTRKLEKDGFTKKTRELDQKQSGEVLYWREQWAKAVNAHLRACGIEKVVDHRSLKEQGLERQPTIKLGVNAAALERKGFKTDKGEYNRAITAYNPDKLNEHLTVQFKQAKELHNKLNFIKKRIPEVKRDIAEKQPKLYKAFDDMGIPTATDERIIEHEQSTEQAKPVSSRVGRSPSVESNSNERGRELSPAGKCESHELGQGHTSEVRRSDNAETVTTLRDKLSNSKILGNITKQKLGVIIDTLESKFADHPTDQLEKYETISNKIDQLEQQKVDEVEQARETIVKYNQLKAEVERAFEEANIKPLRQELAQLQQAYDKAEKPFFISQKKWATKQMNERTMLRQMERQISVTEAKNKGRFEQKAKEWIAINQPDRDKSYQEAQQIMREHNEIQQKQNAQLEQQRVRVTSQDNDKGMER